MNFFKFKRIASIWGSSEPQQLIEIFNYLNTINFVGPTSESTLHSVVLHRKICDGLKFSISIIRVYEDPPSVFNYQCYLSLSSLELREAVDALGIWEPTRIVIKSNPVGIFSVGLQHLKWNAEGGDVNPVWQVSSLAEYRHSADAWIRDFEHYFLPILNEITDISTAISFCLKAMKYRKNLWVKSDGYGSAAFEIYTALLMIKNNRVLEANALLKNSLENTNNSALKYELQSFLNWMNAQGLN